MISCYIVDDEFHAINLLSGFIQDTPGLYLAGSSQDPLEALNKIISADPPEVTFVDVNMPQLSGLDLSALISLHTSVIFTTAFPQYAVQAFELQAADYLLKPFTYERFLKALNKIRNPSLLKNGTAPVIKSHFFIKSDIKGKIVRVNFNEITYIEAAQNYVIIYVENGKHITYLTMKEIEDALDSYGFSRIHKSYIINTEKIKSVENGAVILKDKTMVLIGAKYKDHFFEKISSDTLVSKRN